MGLCELCGKETELVRAEIENTELKVCEACSKFGRVLGKVKKEEAVVLPKRKELVVKEELEESVVPDFAERIRKAREKRWMKQEEFGHFLNEKESVISKLETGRLSPTFELAKKLEDFLGIELIKEYSETKITAKKSSENLTIGDIIDIGELND